MTSQLNKLTDGTVEISLTVPWIRIKKHYEKAVEVAASSAQLPGFRKGKAPRDLVEKNLDKSKLYEGLLKELIPQVYNEAISQHKLKPIVTPKIELKEANEGKDWLIRMLTCERPFVELTDFKTAIKDLKASKQKKLWVPGQKPQDEKTPDAAQKPTLDELLNTLYQHIRISIPGLLLEHEVNRLLSDLIDQTKKLGLTVEQYLASTGRTSDSLRHEYEEQAKRTLTLEFALEDISDKEGILVSDDDIDTIIKTAKTEEEKKTLSGQRYYLASILRRQKTIDWLASL